MMSKARAEKGEGEAEDRCGVRVTSRKVALPARRAHGESSRVSSVETGVAAGAPDGSMEEHISHRTDHVSLTG